VTIILSRNTGITAGFAGGTDLAASLFVLGRGIGKMGRSESNERATKESCGNDNPKGPSQCIHVGKYGPPLFRVNLAEGALL
jgi:hypothetical protein